MDFILYEFYHNIKKYFEGLSLGKSDEMHSFEWKGSMKKHSKSIAYRKIKPSK